MWQLLQPPLQGDRVSAAVCDVIFWRDNDKTWQMETKSVARWVVIKWLTTVTDGRYELSTAWVRVDTINGDISGYKTDTSQDIYRWIARLYSEWHSTATEASDDRKATWPSKKTTQIERVSQCRLQADGSFYTPATCAPDGRYDTTVTPAESTSETHSGS